MEYAANILRKDSAFWTLHNATLSAEGLRIRKGGSASTEITIKELARLSEWFRLSFIGTRFTDSYVADIRIKVDAVRTSGEQYSVVGFPVNNANGVYLQEFQVSAGTYDKLTYTIEADNEVLVTLWELCPEASDMNTTVIIDGVEQALPKLLYDYNTSPLELAQQEATVAVITCRLLDTTDVQGHFAITFQATQVTTVVTRFYDNEGEELFAPMYMDANIGHNTLGIPHSFLRRRAGLHSFVVTMQAYQGILTIGTRNCLFTIDAGYLASRTVDMAMDILDLTVRQVNPQSGPDEIWVVGIDGDTTLVRKRRYNEENVTVDWDPVADLGKSIAGAIEFNGKWILREGFAAYTIRTEEAPHVFIVDANNVLWDYATPHDTKPIQLDTGVTWVRACRGFSSTEFPDEDQGLVIAYLKKDGVYYRQLLWREQAQVYSWENAIKLKDGFWTHCNVSRLNDYRLSFQLSSPYENLWLYTDQTWVGQACPPEQWDADLTFLDKQFFFNTAEASTEIVVTLIPGEIRYEVGEEDEEGNPINYLWYVPFQANYKLHWRADIDLDSLLSINGALYTGREDLYWDEAQNAFVVVLRKTHTPDTPPIELGILQVREASGRYVAEVDGGYMHLPAQTITWSSVEEKQVSANTSEKWTAAKIKNIAKSALVFKSVQYTTQPVLEYYELPGITSESAHIVLETVNFDTSITSEQYALGLFNILPGQLTYEGVGVKPI